MDASRCLSHRFSPAHPDQIAMWKAVFLVLAAVSAASCVMTGGLEDVDPTDEGATNALNFAVVQHNRQSNDVFLSQVAEVVRIQRQVGDPR